MERSCGQEDRRCPAPQLRIGVESHRARRSARLSQATQGPCATAGGSDGLPGPDVPSWHDQVRLINATPVLCGMRRETMKRSDLAGWTGYGHSPTILSWLTTTNPGCGMSPLGRRLTFGDLLLLPQSPVGALQRESCSVCRNAMTVRRGVALTGELFCDRHLGQTACALCAMPADAPELAIPLCQRCAGTSIRTEADVGRVLPAVKRQLTTLGIRTITPVRVKLAPSELLQRTVGNHALGATVFQGNEVINILVLHDLPFVRFGATVAHEVMHAYMTQNRFGRVPSQVAEGLCQLLAYAWVIRQEGILATAERRQIEENPDPIYGDGFRQAYEAVRRVGVLRTLATVKHQHRLP